MKNHFFMPYFGNKRSEVEKIYNEIKDDLLNDEIKIIIEPYCGSSAMSYYISTLHPKRFSYILNDNNKKLIELYKIAKSKKKLKEFEKRILEIMTPYPTTKEEYIKIINENTIQAYYIKNKFYNIRPGIYPRIDGPRSKGFINMIKNQKIGLEEHPIINFIRNEKIKFSTDDAVDMIEKDINKTDRYYLIDPPYLCSNNSYYDNVNDTDYNIYEFFYYKQNDIKFKFCFIINKNWIVNIIFKNFNKIEYDKKYQTTKKTVVHLMIKNN